MQGLPTAGSAPMLHGDNFPDPPSLPFVWECDGHPDAGSGIAVRPLYASVPLAAAKDAALYLLLALFDAARVPGARERNAAGKKLGAVLAAGGRRQHVHATACCNASRSHQHPSWAHSIEAGRGPSRSQPAHAVARRFLRSLVSRGEARALIEARTEDTSSALMQPALCS